MGHQTHVFELLFIIHVAPCGCHNFSNSHRLGHHYFKQGEDDCRLNLMAPRTLLFSDEIAFKLLPGGISDFFFLGFWILDEMTSSHLTYEHSITVAVF
jgi:hypothetical protein